VTDEEFRAALANKDNENVIKSITRKFLGQLTADEAHACGLKGLWRALQYYREEFKQKFTTSLYRFVVWECNREVKRVMGAGKSRPHQLLENDADYNKLAVDSIKTFGSDDIEHVMVRMESLHPEHKRVVQQYFLQNLTMEQIGQANGYSKETARQKLNHAVVALRGICAEGLE